MGATWICGTPAGPFFLKAQVIPGRRLSTLVLDWRVTGRFTPRFSREEEEE